MNGSDGNRYLSVLQFKGIYEYCAYWDKVVARAKADEQDTAYAVMIASNKQDANNELTTPARSEREQIEKVKTYGHPLPKDYEDAMARRSFLNMELYNNVYNELIAFLNALEKISTGILPKDAIRPNDRNLGVFSMERALMGLEGIPALYCKKTDKFYGLSEGTAITDKEGKTLRDKDGNERYKLKDGNEAILTQLEEGGEKQWGTRNKKSFLYKEKVPRPKRVVRLFVLVGAYWGRETYWAGVTAVICANYLETKGYSIRITAVMNVTNSGLNFGKDGFVSGTRYSLMDVKGYEEQMDSLSLLYTLADPSFFRIRQFEYYFASQYKYKDTPSNSIGGLVDIDEFEEDIAQMQKQKDIAEEKDVLYYFFGGVNCYNIEQSKEQLVRIICSAEKNNRRTLEQMGYDFSAVMENPLQVEIGGITYSCNTSD